MPAIFRFDLRHNRIAHVGLPVYDEYEVAVKLSIANRNLKGRKGGAKAAAANAQNDISKGEFIFIAGYTSNGVPYGILKKETDGSDF